MPCCDLVPGGISRPVYASRAARILRQITPPDAVAAARCELAAAFPGYLRRIDARVRETRTTPATAVQATGTCLTRLSGVGPVIAAAVIGDVRDVSRFGSRDHFAACNGTAPVEVSCGPRKTCRLQPAREPAAQPRHPHGRGHPDPPPAQRRPRLLRQETGRRQDTRRGPALAEAADQQRHLRLPAGRRPPRRSPHPGPGRAAGERLCSQRGRLTPQAPALRTSRSRARTPPGGRRWQHRAQPCPRPGRSRPFPDRCHPAAGAAPGPGGAPAAQRGRTTWRRGKTTATLGREEGHGSRITAKADQGGGRVPGEPGPQVIGAGQDQRPGLAAGLGPLGAGAAPVGHQGPDRLYRAVAALRRAAGPARLGGPGGADRIKRAGLALPAAVLAAGAVYLDDPDAGRGDVAGQAGAVAAGALDPDQGDGPEPAQPAGARIRPP